MVDRPPEIMRFSVDLHEHLIQVPLPLGDLTQVVGSADADLSGKYWPETIYPSPNAFVTDIHAALMEQIFDIPKRERKADIHHHRELDDLGRCFEVAEQISRHAAMLTGSA